MQEVDSNDIKKFQAGNWIRQLDYKSFSPTKISRPWVLTEPSIQDQLGRADRFLGRLDAFADFIPDIDFFIQMHVSKEALLSNKIEGTQTTMQDVFMEEADLDPEKRNDRQEVSNYILAMNNAIEELKHLPISNRLLKDTHNTLLSGVRGTHKQPGMFRESQNWIGPSLKNAVYVPPHHDEVQELMADLENLINSSKLHNSFRVVPLIKTAITHYQFETIHPFLDGNGRLGRLLITLMLVDAGILKRPTLYLSDFFERNKTYYYEYLMAGRTHNKLEEWIGFFLQGVEETARRSIETFSKVEKLRKNSEQHIMPLFGKKQQEAILVLQMLYKNPVTSSKGIQTLLNVHLSTATRMLSDFEKHGLLREITGRKRSRIFIFEPYLAIFR